MDSSVLCNVSWFRIRRTALRLHIPRLPEVARQILAGMVVSGNPFTLVVPLNPTAGAKRDIRQQTALLAEPGDVRGKRQTGHFQLQKGCWRTRRARELMVFYCERAAGFCSDIGYQDEGYFDALVRMFTILDLDSRARVIDMAGLMGRYDLIQFRREDLRKRRAPHSLVLSFL